jgi:tRNA-dihydrouridine synthase
MIGRAAPANPWIFRQIAQYTATGRYDQPTEMDRYRMIRTYFEMLVTAEYPDAQGPEVIGKMKQFATWFTHGVPGGAALRKSIYMSKTSEAVLGVVEQFFEGRQALADQGPAMPLDQLNSCDAVPEPAFQG